MTFADAPAVVRQLAQKMNDKQHNCHFCCFSIGSSCRNNQMLMICHIEKSHQGSWIEGQIALFPKITGNCSFYQKGLQVPFT